MALSKTCLKLSFIVAIAVAFTAGLFVSANADVSVPWDNVASMHDYETLRSRGILTGRVDRLPPVGPWWLSEYANLRTGLDTGAVERIMSRTEEGEARLFGMGSQRFRARSGRSAQDLLGLSAGVRYEASPNFGALVIMALDREKALDPDYIGKKWRGLAGDIQTAALYFQHSDFRFTLGRQRIWWGAQPVNLVLSATAEPLDMFSAQYSHGRLDFSFMFARLDGSRPDSADKARYPEYAFGSENRYIVGHRLDLRLHRGLRLGLFETSVFGGVGRPPELYYLNPLQFFHAAQLNENVNDNTFLGADLLWLPGKNVAAWGQLLIDDFQIDDRVQGDQEPNEIGLMLGLQRAAEVGSWQPDIKIEYVRITNRTYHQMHPRNRYLYRNEPLGHPLGMDADSLSASVTFRPSRYHSFSIEAAYSRHGEGSLYDPWDEPWMEADGEYSESFPTGIVQKTMHLAAGIRGYVPINDYTRRHMYLSLDAGWTDFDNRYHVEGHDESDLWLKLNFSWFGAFSADMKP